MTGTRISDMVSKAALAAGDMVPIISGGINYEFDLGSALGAINIGAFTSISTLTIPSSVDRIQTSEYRSGTGTGGGAYIRWTASLTALPTTAVGANAWWATSADGGKWYPDLNRLTYRQLGAYGDYVYATKTIGHDDYAAFLAYRQLCEWGRIDNDAFNLYAACPALFVEPGNYYHTDRLDFDFGTVLVQAPFIGAQNGGNPVVFTFASGKGGYKLFYASESVRTGAVGAMGSTLRNIKFRSHGVGSDTTVPGGLIHSVQCHSDNCSYEDFPGHGLAIIADTGGTPPTNGNLCTITGGNFRSNGYNGVGSGLYLQGGDSNQITINGAPNFYSNAQWGIDEQSFLGTLIIGAHADSNGIIGAGTRNSPQAVGSLCSSGGNRYAVTAGLAATAKTQTPGTGTAWTRIGTGGVGGSFPAYVSGTTVIEGGAYHSNNVAGFPTFLHCYSEGTQGPSQFTQTTIIIGGLHGAGISGGGLETSSNGSIVFNALGTVGTTTAPEYVRTLLGGPAGTLGTFFQLGRATDGTLVWGWELDSSQILRFRYAGLDNTSPLNLIGGTGNHQYSAQMPNGAYIGALFRSTGSAVPASGTWEVGAFVSNDLSVSTKEKGWLCTVAGTPGTWLAEYRDLYGSTTVDLASIASGANSASISITVTGAVVGDIVSGVSTSDGSIPLGAIISGQVTSANTVTAFIRNNNAGAYDPPSATYRAKVTRQ